MAAFRQYHIFISHSWDYDNHYRKIVSWFDNEPLFFWSNYSVPVSNPLDVSGTGSLKKELSERIARSSCVIILSGMYVNYSDWIDYEIDTAVRYGKPIIGVRPWSQERVPTKVQQHAIAMVSWNSSSIVGAVRRYAL